MNWRPISEAPRDGTHILACCGPYDQWITFQQFPPFVVHWWGNAGEEGFYLSTGIVEGHYTDQPMRVTHWMPLPPTPGAVPSASPSIPEGKE